MNQVRFSCQQQEQYLHPNKQYSASELILPGSGLGSLIPLLFLLKICLFRRQHQDTFRSFLLKWDYYYGDYYKFGMKTHLLSLLR